MRESEFFADCFDPVYDENSKVLLLGSNPPPDSREAEFYYSGPHNRFWQTISAVFGEPMPTGNDNAEKIAAKKAFCYKHRIALWDVFKACDRVGASDSTIKNEEPNDIKGLLEKTNITHVFCLGQKAYDGYCELRKKLNKAIPEADLLVSSSCAARRAKSDAELIVHYKEELMKVLG